MPLIEINRNPTDRDLRQFATIWLPAFCALVGVVVYRRTGSLVWPSLLATLAITVAAVGAIKARAVRPLFIGWITATYPIGWVVSHTILAVVFYLAVTPIGILRRTIGGDPLSRRFDRAARTYWIPRSSKPESARYFRQF